MMVSTVGLILAIALFFLGLFLYGRYSFAHSTVQDQLQAQNISFPPEEALSPEERESGDVAKYAGEVVDNGPEAESYANDFIGLHLQGVANGMTYSEASAASRENPDDEELQGQVQTLFRGETLRGLLLTTYGFWELGQEARRVAIVLWIGAGLLLILSGLGYLHALRSPRRNDTAEPAAPAAAPAEAAAKV
jgi:hypothetical protein